MTRSPHGNNSRVQWKKAPEAHDFPAAANYLDLLASPAEVRIIIDNLAHAQLSHHKAKDILRAAGLPLLGSDNPHVASDLVKIADGEALSPILLVRGELLTNRPLHIADGYHRVCAVYLTDENTDIPALMVDPPR